MNTAAAPVAADRVELPVVPLIVMTLVFLGVGAVMVVPSFLQAQTLREPVEFDFDKHHFQVFPTWKAHTYAGRCRVETFLVDPEGSVGKKIAEQLGDEVVAISLSFDNSRGIRPVRFDTATARFYDFIGRGIPCLPVGELKRLAPSSSLLQNHRDAATVEVGGRLSPHFIFFDRQTVLERLDRLYALQVAIDDNPYYNLIGRYVSAKEEAEEQLQMLMRRQKAGLPVPMPSDALGTTNPAPRSNQPTGE